MRCAHDATALKINNAIDAKATSHRQGIDLLHVWSPALRSDVCIAVRVSLMAVEESERSVLSAWKVSAQ